ncbi:response regulator [Marinobacter adhaerens]|jgi:DNA-binding NarL/FixJ family response regulator|uniref:response regulator n=1 Tax=Marinobacter adhaerens TaxID=1033846 RepID=UPI001E5F0E0B|nr:response regulator transcription factor [Marinobacter adhaerens]MCD1646507.1 response regulator transcription factor [Marinobacter adhaerens]
MDNKTVLLVDDHQLVRAGLRNLIENMEGFEVIAEGADGSDAVELAKREKPDICMLDISMRDMSGLEALAELRAQGCVTKVIILSMHDSSEYVSKALRAGANGYLLKDSAETELHLALQAVIAGQVYLSPRVSGDVVKAALSGRHSYQANEDIPLTERQQEILRLIADGKGTKEIAWELGVSPKTIESHRAQIMERLQIRDIAGLIRYAFRHGLTDL